ncbi:hypothetical protein EAO74_06620 [Streptomyces sp. gb1(2016)]|uniref:Uncharacterized protein n=1 Tax=Streptomyces sp. gb1(2016) TaxID=1828321 RepID=A0A652LA40_9ACTN|nr:hypothetical protein EAO74_06620 [Streptomyces sp. gb1(2016)]
MHLQITRPVVAEARVRELLLEEGADRPRMMGVGLHLRISGRPSRAADLRGFLGHARYARDYDGKGYDASKGGGHDEAKSGSLMSGASAAATTKLQQFGVVVGAPGRRARRPGSRLPSGSRTGHSW